MLDGADADHAGVCVPDVGRNGSAGGDPGGDEMTFSADNLPERLSALNVFMMIF